MLIFNGIYLTRKRPPNQLQLIPNWNGSPLNTLYRCSLCSFAATSRSVWLFPVSPNPCREPVRLLSFPTSNNHSQPRLSLRFLWAVLQCKEWPATIQRLHRILQYWLSCPTGIHWPVGVHWLHNLVHTGFPCPQSAVLSYHINEKCRSLWERLVKHKCNSTTLLSVVYWTVCKLSVSNVSMS